jgi:Lectin C-type domain
MTVSGKTFPPTSATNRLNFPEFSSERCAAQNLNADTVLTTFARTCYEFHVTRGESFERARDICKKHGGDLIYNFRGPTQHFILSELERRKPDLRTQLVWIGAQKEPGLTARTWKWVNGTYILVTLYANREFLPQLPFIIANLSLDLHKKYSQELLCKSMM